MSKIRVSHFGPIKRGLEGNAFLEMDKVTLLIGNQATGKSSVAKLFSTISWLEKSLFRKEIKESDVTTDSRFIDKHCSYQRINEYFHKNTEIEYIGDLYRFLYKNGKVTLTKQEDNRKYPPPKIMYVPAERNFLSVVERPEKIKGLPRPLYTFLDEFERSKTELNETINLPVNNVKFEYQKQNKQSYIKGKGFKLRLHEASSGIQSLLPVFLVSKNLADSINQKKGNNNNKKISVEQQRNLEKEISKILDNDNLIEEIKEILIEKLSATYKNLCFINIVEEIEQNLFPSSQRDLINELLRFNNLTNDNKLVLTTHSPYILNYLTLAIKGSKIIHSPHVSNLPKEIEEKLETVIPINSCVPSSKVKIYEFSNDGNITLLPNHQGIPSDDNYLNEFLSDTNELFDQLLEIEEELL